MVLQKQIEAHFLEFQQTEEGKYKLPLRQKALKRFNEEGFPTTKNEEWKYTSLRELIKKEYSFIQNAEKIPNEKVKEYFLGKETYKIVFTNGVFNEELSDIDTTEFTVQPLSKAFKNKNLNDLIEKYLDATTEKEETVNALNTAFMTEGVFAWIPKSYVVEKPIEIIYVSNQKEEVFVQPRNLIIAEENSQVQFFETHQNLSDDNLFINSVTEIFVDKNAIVEFDKLQNNGNNTSMIDSTYVQQKKDSVATVNTFTFGGNLIRNNLNFYQIEDHIISNLNGVVALTDNQHVDNHTLVHHTQPNCESHELYKAIYDDASTGVFNGKVLVNKEAQKLDAYQQNDNVIIGDKASVNSKPQLEIFADDVRCSHGCTIGELDKEALFYMQQRGIAKKEAEALLLYAFANEAIEKIKIQTLKQKVSKIIAEKLNVNMEFYL